MTRTLVGLDIGSTGLRAAEFVPGRRRGTLRRFAALPLPAGVVRAGTVVDGDALTDAIRELWAKGKFGTRRVTLGIANAGVLVRQMDLDWMPPADFRKALRYQVEDALPFPVEDANLDFHLLEELDLPGEHDESRRVSRILLVAATREVVDLFVAAAERAGLRPCGVDLLPFALVRARTATRERRDEVEAIVDIGADVVTVVVHDGGVPRYVRMIPGVGGDSITRAVQQRYDWTWEDAERTKVFVGLPGHAHLDAGQQETVAPRTDGLDHPAQKVIVAATDALVEEILSTLDYYRTSAADVDGHRAEHPADVARVLLAGSGALLGGLRELLEERLERPVDRLDVRRQIRAPRRARLGAGDAASLVVPAGLCAGVGR